MYHFACLGKRAENAQPNGLHQHIADGRRLDRPGQHGTVAGIGGELIPHEAIRLRQEHWIGELARRFVAMVAEGRGQVVR